MQVICKPSMNTIFWRRGQHDDWCWTDLEELIEMYEDEPFTELEYQFPVLRDGTEDILYHVFKCTECEKLVLSVDVDHGYEYCPHCGRSIWKGIDEERDL